MDALTRSSSARGRNDAARGSVVLALLGLALPIGAFAVARQVESVSLVQATAVSCGSIALGGGAVLLARRSLREARVRQQLELGEVELATKIRARYLRALEEESFEALPAQTYVKGFLRTYADYLGLDGQLYVDEFNSRYGGDGEEPREPVIARRTSQVGRQHHRMERRWVLFALVGIA